MINNFVLILSPGDFRDRFSSCDSSPWVPSQRWSFVSFIQRGRGRQNQRHRQQIQQGSKQSSNHHHHHHQSAYSSVSDNKFVSGCRLKCRHYIKERRRRRRAEETQKEDSHREEDLRVLQYSVHKVLVQHGKCENNIYRLISAHVLQVCDESVKHRYLWRIASLFGFTEKMKTKSGTRTKSLSTAARCVF